MVFEEEKRLCYVAMTRAKSELVMSWRKEVPIFTSTGMARKQAQRSRFLDTLTKKASMSKGKNSRILNGEGSTRQQSLRGDKRATGLSKRQFSGTTRVVSSQKRPFSDRVILSPSRTKVPNRNGTQPSQTVGKPFVAPTRRAGASQTVKKTAVSASRERWPLAGNRRKVTLSSSQRLAPLAGAKTSADENELMDSTWFFPVGSTVQHKTHGRGIVLPSAASVNMMVRVRFASGDELEFPVHGSEISPVIT